MLDTCGLQSIENLYEHLPREVLMDAPLGIDPGKSEYEIIDYFRERADRCATGYASFLGAGVYRHYRPVMVDTVVSRGEFLTSYTPYQPEISQGTLTAIFEFQTMICQLTGMDAANASMYDGSSAVPEAALMAARVTGRHRVLVARTLHPEYRDVLRTYAKHDGLVIDEFDYDAETGRVNTGDLEAKLDDRTAAVIIQNPNFMGVVEDVGEIAALAHSKGSLLVSIFTEAVALGLLAPPEDADIVAGELQSFAISPSYGGPFAGIVATKDKYVRQLPGRLAGETRDSRGRRAFCLTLSTREQHIRRERATSNICTNQALIALMASVFMSVYGRRGLRELAEQNLAKAHYLSKGLKLKFQGRFFNEFVACTNGSGPAEVNRRLLDQRIIGGLQLDRWYPELKGCMLLCATEMSRREDMNKVIGAFA